MPQTMYRIDFKKMWGEISHGVHIIDVEGKIEIAVDVRDKDQQEKVRMAIEKIETSVAWMLGEML